MIYGFQSWCPIPLPRSLKSMGSWLKVTIAPLPRAKKKLAVLRLWGAIYEETQFWPHNSKLLKNGLVPLILLGAFLRHESSFVSFSTGHQVFEGLNYKSSPFLRDLVNAFFQAKLLWGYCQMNHGLMLGDSSSLPLVKLRQIGDIIQFSTRFLAQHKLMLILGFVILDFHFHLVQNESSERRTKEGANW